MHRFECVPRVQELPLLQTLQCGRRELQRMPLMQRLMRAVTLMSLMLLALPTCDVSASLLAPGAVAQSQLSIAHVGSEPGRRKARERVVEDVTRAWNIHSREPLQLIVLDCDARGRAYKSELRQLFPQGVKHLPPSFAPRSIYLIEPKGKQRVQYLGRANQNGFKFAVFRSLEDESSVKENPG